MVRVGLHHAALAGCGGEGIPEGSAEVGRTGEASPCPDRGDWPVAQRRTSQVTSGAFESATTDPNGDRRILRLEKLVQVSQ
jgi:hypothetical protein